MKLKLTLLSLAGLFAASLIAAAENNTPAAENSQPTPAATAPATIAAAPTDATPAASPAATTNAPADTNATATAAAPVAPAATPAPAADAAASSTTSTNGVTGHDANAVIPLIVMDEVPLIDAIKNLARQANLNYMLDPKISYGAPGPDGKPTAQPTVSLRWENLTADQALYAVLNNYNLTVVEDPKTKIARITVKDPLAPEPLVSKIIQLKYAYATNLVVNVQAILQDKRSKVIADTRTAQLIVLATDKEMVAVDELIIRLDTQTKQVLIEARLIETSKNPISSKGIDWSGTLQAQHVTFGNGNTTGTYQSSVGGTTAINAGTGSLPVGTITPPYIGANPVILSTTTPNGTFVSANGTGSTHGTTDGNVLNSVVGNGGFGLNTAKGLFPATAFLNADGVSAVLSFLNSDLDATVISTPRAVTLDNETAKLSVTTAYPIFKATAGTQGSPGGSEVTYTNLGTILYVTPRISANNTISLKVIPEVSSLFGTSQKVVAGLVNQADIYDVRRIETQVLIPSGNTLVMGGLISDDRSKGYTKVPLLGDIPFLGAAFRSQSKSQNKKNLIIFVTPTIVEKEDFQPTETSFLKTKLKDQVGSPDFGAWDSGKPQDWSKLWKKDKKSVATESSSADQY